MKHCGDTCRALEEKLYREGMHFNGSLPRVGSIIVFNDVSYKDDISKNRAHARRGVVFIEGYTRNLVICQEFYGGKAMTGKTCLRIMDFLKELIIYEEVEKPPVAKAWAELGIENFKSKENVL